MGALAVHCLFPSTKIHLPFASTHETREESWAGVFMFGASSLHHTNRSTNEPSECLVNATHLVATVIIETPFNLPDISATFLFLFNWFEDLV